MMENSADRSTAGSCINGILGALLVGMIAFGAFILIVGAMMESGSSSAASTPDTPNTASAPDPTLTVVRYVPQATNVRAGRSTETEIVTTLDRGDTVRTEERRDGWARVYPYGDGADSALGYVYVNVLADSPPPAREPSTAQAETQEPQFNADLYLLDAWVLCQRFLEDRLRAPSTADYPWGYSNFTTYEGDRQYRVRAYVDAENAFGTNVRTQFDCQLEYRGIREGQRKYQLLDLSTW